jgi:myo-inositol-1(or 4)-monophosphatase
MMPWDVAAGLILVTEAGGLVSDYGADDGWRVGNAILATSPAMASAFCTITGLVAGKARGHADE